MVVSFIGGETLFSVLLVEETKVPRENHRPVASHWQTSSHNVVSSTPRMSGVRTHNDGPLVNFVKGRII